MINQVWRFVVLTFVRPMFKWFLRKLTGKCELQRIINSTNAGAKRTLKIETSLKHSKCAVLKRLLTDDAINLENVVAEIHKVKDIREEVHPLFGPAIKVCIGQITGYRKLLLEVEAIRKETYSDENPEHEEMLMTLWTKLCPDAPLESRVTKQWGDIGFQGDDPMTDFRGMGILGLQNLIFLVTQYTETARQLLLHSHHPKYGYSFAIVGINITGMAHRLLKNGHLKTHLFNVVQHSPSILHFHQIYCYLFYDFDKFWRQEEPEDIMQFNIVRKKYEMSIINKLRTDKSATLKGQFASE